MAQNPNETSSPLPLLGTHLANPPYHDDIRVLLNKYPNLRYPDNKRYEDYPFQQPLNSRSRVACVEFARSNTISHQTFDSLPDLETFLTQEPPAGARRLFLLEELQPDYVTAVGHKLRIPPNVISRHRRKALWEYDHDAGNTPPLPSLNDRSTSFSFQYWELVFFKDQLKDFYLRCADNERHIAVSRIDGRFDNVGIVQRKASFWSKPTRGDGWDAILIVDGPVKEVLLGSGQTYSRTAMPCVPFQGGYADFIQYADLDSAKSTSGPPRTCLFDDLVYFYSHHSSCLTITSSPASSMLFFKKIVCSHFMMLREYYRGVLSHLEWLLSRRETFANLTLDWVEERCSDLHAFNRRCEEYANDIASMSEQLGLGRQTLNSPTPSCCGQTKAESPYPQPDEQQLSSSSSTVTTNPPAPPTKAWTSSATDLQHLETRFASLKDKSSALLTSFTNLATIAGNRQSLSEARSVRALTYLGLTFLPLSLVTGVFSMNDSYLPGSRSGGRRFWIPLVVATLLVITVFWLSFVTTGTGHEAHSGGVSASTLSSFTSWLGSVGWRRRRGSAPAEQTRRRSWTSRPLLTRLLLKVAEVRALWSRRARARSRTLRHGHVVDEEKCTPVHDDGA